MKLWVGFLAEEWAGSIEFLEEFSADIWFDPDKTRGLLPLAAALVDVAHEHFAFFSADGLGEIEEQMDGLNTDRSVTLDGEPLGPGDVGSHVDDRLTRLEQAMMTMTAEMRKMVGNAPSQPPAGAKKKPTTPANPKPKKISQKTLPAREQLGRSDFPSLDPEVVTAAIQAGVPRSNLEEMQRLMDLNPKSRKMTDLNTAVKPLPDPLSEDEQLQRPGQLEEEQGELGSADAVATSLAKLTSIVELLTDDRKKKMAGSKLEMALETSTATSSDTPLQGTGKKAAAARRALRATYEENPGEIASLIEKLMWEDLRTATLGPGMSAQGHNGPGWNFDRGSRATELQHTVLGALLGSWTR